MGGGGGEGAFEPWQSVCVCVVGGVKCMGEGKQKVQHFQEAPWHPRIPTLSEKVCNFLEVGLGAKYF